MICYFLLTIYSNITKVKVIILAYYFIHKIITKSFIDKRAFLSIRKDITNNYLKSKIKRFGNKYFREYLFDIFFTSI